MVLERPAAAEANVPRTPQRASAVEIPAADDLDSSLEEEISAAMNNGDLSTPIESQPTRKNNLPKVLKKSAPGAKVKALFRRFTAVKFPRRWSS